MTGTFQTAKVCLLAGVTALASAGLASAEPTKAEVMHWWTSGGESAAVKVFADQYAKAGGTWVDSAVAGGAAARTAIINRLVGGKPATMMQFNTGKQFDELVSNNLLADVSTLTDTAAWKKFIPAAFIDAVTRNGKVYAVPVNIHGQNWMWYNKAVFDKAGAMPPGNASELIAALDKIKASGAIPLALGGQKWQEKSLFNSIMASQSKDLYAAFYSKHDAATVASADFRAVAEAYGKLRGYVDQGSPGRNWNDATAMVISGKAGVQFMGDWAKGEFIGANQTPGKEYGCAVMGQGYVMGGDVFVFAASTDAGIVAAEKVLAGVLMDPETQIKFAQKKGSIPIRTDIDVSSLDACAQTGVKMVSDAVRQVPAAEMLASASLNGAIEDTISEFWNKSAITPEQFIAKMTAVLKDAN